MDKGPDHEPVEVGGGLKLPVYELGASNHAIWAMWVLNIVLGMIFACMIFSYLFLWSVQPDRWPPPGAYTPTVLHTLVPLLLYAAAGAAVILAGRVLDRNKLLPSALVGAALASTIGGIAVDIYLWRSAGLTPTESSYGATIFTFGFLNGLLAFTLTFMAGFVIARLLTGRMNGIRRLSFDTTKLLWSYALAQAIITIFITHFFPRVTS